MGIVLTYTCILYKKDVVRMRNDYNEQVQKENNAKAEAARQANRDARRHAPATAQNAATAIPSPVPSARPAQAPAVPKVSAEPGKVNWSLQPGVKVRQSSNRNMLGAYGPEKAVDGNTSSRISDVSISATGVVEGKPPGSALTSAGDQPHHRKGGHLHAGQPDAAGHHGKIQGNPLRQ